MDFVKPAKGIEREVIAARRDFHAHPEIAFKEVRTSGIVEKRLKRLGIKTKRMAGTGIAGYLDVAGAKKTVALRADMDALPMEEKARVSFAAKGPAMHSCGHDAHTAMLLGAAKILAGLGGELRGNVRFIFQPSEEKPPGGAKAMVAEGVMEGVDEVYGLHVGSQIPSGKIVAEAGAQMANGDSLTVRITGRGAHGASPELSADPVLAACEAVVSLQQVVSRNILPVEPAVLSICAIHAGTAYNIIPEISTLKGTVRTFSKNLRRRMPKMISRVLGGIAKAHGVAFEMECERGYDAVVNDAKAAERVRDAAAAMFGKKSLHAMGPQMGAEDFSEYLKCARGCFFMLGTGNKKKKTDISHHSPYFKVDESVLYRGTAMLAKLAWGGLSPLS